MNDIRLDWYMKAILSSVTRINKEEDKFIKKLDEINKESVRKDKNNEKKN